MASEAFARSLLPDHPRWGGTADAFVSPPFSPPSGSVSMSQSLEPERSGIARRGGPQALETALKRSLRQPSFYAAENADALRKTETGAAVVTPQTSRSAAASASSPTSLHIAPRSPWWVRRFVSLSLLGISTGAMAPARKGPAFCLVAAPELVLKGVGPSMTFFVDLDQRPGMPVAVPNDF